VQRTELASGRITSTETIIVELIQADETPAVVIVRWPAKHTVIHPHRFPGAAGKAARTFAAAAVKLAKGRRERKTLLRDCAEIEGLLQTRSRIELEVSNAELPAPGTKWGPIADGQPADS